MIGGKVIHVSDRLHRILQKFCKRNDVPLYEWAEEALKICLDACRVKRPYKAKRTRRPKCRKTGSTESNSESNENKVIALHQP